MLKKLRKAKARRLVKNGWEVTEIINRKRSGLSTKELTEIRRIETQKLQKKSLDKLDSKIDTLNSNIDGQKIASDSITTANIQSPPYIFFDQSSPTVMTIDGSDEDMPDQERAEEPKEKLHLPDFIQRDHFYDEQIAPILEGMASDSGISYNFFKERFLVGDGCCWICGSKLKSAMHFFCPWHNVDAKLEMEKWKQLDVDKIGRWALDHEDFKLPHRFLCPKCEDRPHATNDYLCAFCRGQ